MTIEGKVPADAAGTPGAGSGEPWYSSFVDADVKGWVASLNADSAETIARKAWHQEKLLGADKAGRAVVWPKDENDAEGWKAIRARMGVPDTADAYGLKPAEGQSDDFLKAAAPVLHKLGLSKAQAEGLNQFLTEYTGSQQKALGEQVAAKTAAALAQVKSEWGAAYDQNVALSQRAARALGLEQADLEQMEASFGTAKLMQFMHKIGSMLGEDRFAEGAAPAERQYTPDAAKARLEQLMLDSEWLKKFAAGDVAAMEEKKRLDMAMLGQKAA